MRHPSLPRLVVAAAAALALTAGAVGAQAQQAVPSRGELLYETHCKACHTTQLHWRDRRQAGDWPSLKGWVGHWQRELELGWSEADITDVARYLNDRYYHHPQGSDRSAGAGPQRAARAQGFDARQGKTPVAP